MKDNPIQFAVVREDPLIEHKIVQTMKAKSILMIGSGGCTAFSLNCLEPNLNIGLFDLNPAQLDLIKRKVDILSKPLSSESKIRFGIGRDTLDGLCTGGNFESLFRNFRQFLVDFAGNSPHLESLFQQGSKRLDAVDQITKNKYWAIAFDLFFSDSLLTTMFGPEAVQHAVKGSYPKYFRRILEQGLRSPDAPTNYFLHHIFLGYYLDREDSLPLYLKAGPRIYSFSYHLGDLATVPDLPSYEVISLSNIFDWMSPVDIKKIAAYLSAKAKPKTAVVWRQLGHDTDASPAFSGDWTLDHDLATNLLQIDRSLFYSRIYIAVRT